MSCVLGIILSSPAGISLIAGHTYWPRHRDPSAPGTGPIAGLLVQSAGNDPWWSVAIISSCCVYILHWDLHLRRKEERGRF
jgi:hypothetical protein